MKTKIMQTRRVSRAQGANAYVVTTSAGERFTIEPDERGWRCRGQEFATVKMAKLAIEAGELDEPEDEPQPTFAHVPAPALLAYQLTTSGRGWDADIRAEAVRTLQAAGYCDGDGVVDFVEACRVIDKYKLSGVEQ